MRARLINPEQLTIQPINRSALRVDALALEPSARIDREAALTIKGQVDETDRNRRQPGQGGATVSQRAIVTFLSADLARLGYSPEAGDLITTISDEDGTNARPVRWYVQEAHATGKERRRPRLVQVQVSDRMPGRASTEGI